MGQEDQTQCMLDQEADFLTEHDLRSFHAGTHFQIFEKFGAHPGQRKLYTIWRKLACRQQIRKVFDDGEYVPLEVSGEQRRHVCAFVRVHNCAKLLVVAPRLIVGLLKGRRSLPLGREVWADARVSLPPGLSGSFLNIFSGEKLAVSSSSPVMPIASALASFPVAVLVST